MNTHDTILEVIDNYANASAGVDIVELGTGNINDTYLLKTPDQRQVLQRINPHVFPCPERLIENHKKLHMHFHTQPQPEGQGLTIPDLIPTLEGEFSVSDRDGNIWRMLSYIENTIASERIHSPSQARQSGWALGRFHKQLARLDPQHLEVPLPGFHHLSLYLNQYDTIEPRKNPSEAELFCIDTIASLREKSLTLEQAAAEGRVQQKIIHGDPKIGNMLFDKQSNRAVSIIDLDTVGPGLLQHDIGDWLRSICNRGGETAQSNAVFFDMELFRIGLKSYLEEAKEVVHYNEWNYIYEGLVAITFELGLRFFSDYLQGNIYFKCSDPLENLHKALSQFHLCRDIKKKEAHIRALLTNNEP